GVPGDGSWEHYINYFSAESYVFLRVGGAGGARVGGGGFPGWPDAARQDRFDGRIFKEEDRLNLPQDGSGSGLEWFGEEVSDGRPVTTVLDTVPPGLAGGTVRWRARVAGRARPAVTMALRIGGETVASALIPQHSLSPEAPLGFARELEFEQDVAGRARRALDLALLDGPGPATGRLHWLEAGYPRTLGPPASSSSSRTSPAARGSPSTWRSWTSGARRPGGSTGSRPSTPARSTRTRGCSGSTRPAGRPAGSSSPSAGSPPSRRCGT